MDDVPSADASAPTTAAHTRRDEEVAEERRRKDRERKRAARVAAKERVQVEPVAPSSAGSIPKRGPAAAALTTQPAARTKNAAQAGSKQAATSQHNDAASKDESLQTPGM